MEIRGGMSWVDVMVVGIANRVFCFVYLSWLPSPPTVCVWNARFFCSLSACLLAGFCLLLLSSALLACLLPLVLLIGLHTFLNLFGSDLEHQGTPEPCDLRSAAAIPTARDHQHERLSEFVTLSHR